MKTESGRERKKEGRESIERIEKQTICVEADQGIRTRCIQG